MSPTTFEMVPNKTTNQQEGVKSSPYHPPQNKHNKNKQTTGGPSRTLPESCPTPPQTPFLLDPSTPSPSADFPVFRQGATSVQARSLGNLSRKAPRAACQEVWPHDAYASKARQNRRNACQNQRTPGTIPTTNMGLCTDPLSCSLGKRELFLGKTSFSGAATQKKEKERNRVPLNNCAAVEKLLSSWPGGLCASMLVGGRVSFLALVEKPR